MKPEHTYCFYMSNGEHIMEEADSMDVLDDCVLLHRESEAQPFMQIFKSHLMAWEVNR